MTNHVARIKDFRLQRRQKFEVLKQKYPALNLENVSWNPSPSLCLMFLIYDLLESEVTVSNNRRLALATARLRSRNQQQT